MGAATTELVDPAGEIVGDSVDELVDAYQRCCERLSAERDFADQLRRRLGDMTAGDKLTRRVEGQRHIARIVMPRTTFSQSGLQVLWDKYPTLAPRFMHVASYSVSRREVDKLRNTATDDPELSRFRDTLLRCEQQSTAPPTVVVEK